MNSKLETRNAEPERTSRGEDSLARTKSFGLRVIRLVQSLPGDSVAKVLGKQLLRSATSVGANDRAARRARSTAAFCARLGVAEEEADESGYWLELLADSGVVKPALLSALREDADEITAMVVASILTARKRKAKMV